MRTAVLVCLAVARVGDQRASRSARAPVEVLVVDHVERPYAKLAGLEAELDTSDPFLASKEGEPGQL